MIIGVPKEVKVLENRVSLQPSGAEILINRGHQVVVEQAAGLNSGFVDEDYIAAGAKILDTAEAVWERAQMIVKVKEPVEHEYGRMRAGQIVFTYFHFAAAPGLFQAVMDSNCIAIAYETVETPDRKLPLLTPMSEVAGRMAVYQAAKYLERNTGGRGLLMGGLPGVPPAHVLILGGGVVGTNAAKMAAGMGAQVTILDISLDRMRYLDDVMPRNVITQMSTPAAIRELCPQVDVVIGGVLVPGGRAPKLITREHLKLMKDGSVLIDVAIDQGGSFESSRPTTHQDPVFIEDGVVHYCVTNMPGAVPVTSTQALTNATLPYVVELANKGYLKAMRDNLTLRSGVNILGGTVTHPAVAADYDKVYVPPEEVLKDPELRPEVE